MNGIILAAGKGTRLNGVDLKPKCLFEIGGETLLERQIFQLLAVMMKEIVVVVGFEAERIRSRCPPHVKFITNERFEDTSSLYSLWLAQDYMYDDGFIVLNCDVLFHPRLMLRLVTCPYEVDAALTVDFVGKESNPLGDEEMKVKVSGGLVVDISKDMNPAEADGENVGMAMFNKRGARMLLPELERLISRGDCDREWAPRAFRDYARQRPLHALSTLHYPWIEIDFPEDYRRAQEEIFPKIKTTV